MSLKKLGVLTVICLTLLAMVWGIAACGGDETTETTVAPDGTETTSAPDSSDHENGRAEDRGVHPALRASQRGWHCFQGRVGDGF